jgi:hypothetical protein
VKRTPASKYKHSCFGLPAYLLGNGESLNEAGAIPSGGVTIGINRSWTLYPETDHWVFSGGALHSRELAAGDHVPKIAWTWDHFLLELGVHAVENQPGELVVIPKLPDDARERFRADLPFGSNAWFAGLLAIHVTAWLGCDPIYLIGFDSHGGHHYPDQRRVDRTDFIPYYGPVKDWAIQTGTRIVNCSASSVIPFFERGAPGG